jgi:hypothetical protein
MKKNDIKFCPDSRNSITVTPTELKGLKNLSTSVKKTIIDHRIDIEDKKYNNTWKSCCFVIDKRAVQFFTQTFLMFITMMFCIYQLITLTSCQEQQTYIALLSTTLGLLRGLKFSDKS